MKEGNTEKSAGEADSQRKSQLKETLLTSSEGACLLIGVALAVIFIFTLGIKLLLSPEDSQVLIGMTATEAVFGRAAAMAFGYSMGLGHITVILICMMLETILVLLFYPLFVFTWRQLLILKWFKKMFERTREAA